MDAAKKNSYLLTVYFFVLVMYYFMPSFIKLSFGIVFLIFSFLLTKKVGVKKNIFYNVLFIVVSVIIFQFLKGEFLFSVFLLVTNFFVVNFIVRSDFNIKVLLRGYYLFSFFFFLLAIARVDPNTILVETSRNFINVFFLVYVVLIYTICYIQQHRINVLPSILCLAFSLWSLGRSGIVCSLLLVVFVIFFNRKYIKFHYKLILALVFALALILFFFTGLYDVFGETESVIRFSERKFESTERDMLLDTYLENIDLRSFLVGYDYTNNFLFNSFGNNPHNSFIRFHSSYGVIAFIVFLIMLYTIFRKGRRHYVLMVFLLILLLRASTDIVFFIDKFDFLIMYIVIGFFITNEEKYYGN